MLPLTRGKSLLGGEQVIFGGHQISAPGIKPPPERIEALKYFQVPENAKFPRFLGMINY